MTFKHKLSRRLAVLPLSLVAVVIAVTACDAAPTEPDLIPFESTIAAALPSSAAYGVPVVTLTRVKVWESGSRFAKTLGSQTKGRTGTILEGPTPVTSREPYPLWRIDYASGADGWTRGDQLGFVEEPTVAPPPLPAPPVVETVSVSPNAITIDTGTTRQLLVTVIDTSGNTMTGQTITYASLNSAIATVSAAGVVRGMASGTVLVSASTGGVSASASVTVTAPSAPAPPPGGDSTGTRQILWSSDWSTGMGLASSAVTDDARWSMLGGQGLEVITASGLGFPTTNVLRVTAVQATTGYAFLRKTGLPIPAVGESNYYRWYFRATMPDGLEDQETHPFQDGNASSQSNWLFHVYHDAGAGRWRPQLRPSSQANAYPNDRWSGPALLKGATYRFEVQIARTGTNTFQMNARIYDQAGTLLHQSNAFTNQTGTATLASNPTFNFLQLANLEGLNAGNNGIAGTPSWPFVYGYQAAIAVCRGNWCGAYQAGEGR